RDFAEARSRAVGGDVVERKATASPRIVDLLVQADRIGERATGLGGDRRRDEKMLGEVVAARERYRAQRRGWPPGGCRRDRGQTGSVHVERQGDDRRAVFREHIAAATTAFEHGLEQGRHQRGERNLVRRL